MIYSLGKMAILNQFIELNWWPVIHFSLRSILSSDLNTSGKVLCFGYCIILTRIALLKACSCIYPGGEVFEATSTFRLRTVFIFTQRAFCISPKMVKSKNGESNFGNILWGWNWQKRKLSFAKYRISANVYGKRTKNTFKQNWPITKN